MTNAAPGRETRIEVHVHDLALGTLVRKHTGLAWSKVRALIEKGRVTVNGTAVTDAGTRLARGSTVEILARPAVDLAGSGEVIRHLDAQVVVVEKPAGMSTVPFEEGERGTLVDRVRVQLHRRGLAGSNSPLFVVHRIDKETSGLVVFARTWLAKRHLATLFREHAIERVYRALIDGVLPSESVTYRSFLVENRGDGLRGSAKQSGLGVEAVTHVARLATLGEGKASLVECRLETGRTHQIRIHLAEHHHPLLGERVYNRHFPPAKVEAPRQMLHAATLAFTHPADPTVTVRVTSALPADFANLARSLGATEAMLKVE